MKTHSLLLLGVFATSFPVMAQTTTTPSPIPPGTTQPAGADVGNANWFQRLDTNSDGALSRDEFARFSALSGTTPANDNVTGSTTATTGTGAKGTFQTLDTNDDERISKEEFAHFPALNGTSQPGVKPPKPKKTD